jgi:predicted permease
MLLPRFRSWFLATLRRSSMEREMDAELRLHIESYAEDLVRRGLAREEAVRRAMIEFGSVDVAKEACRDARGAGWLESLIGDLRFGFRALYRRPGLASLTVMTLALGIGAATAVFSLVNAVLLRALPYGDPARLAFLFEALPNVPNVPLEAWSPVNGDFYAWQRQSRSFAELALFTSDRLNVSVGDAAFRVTGSRVTGDFFRTLGVAPEIGRAIDNGDDQPGKGNVAVISYALWQARFGGERGVLGKELSINARPYRVIGVMPAGFAFPHGTESLETAGKTTDVWRPWAMTLQAKASRDENQGSAIGRLRPGVTLRQARAEIEAITARLDPPYQQQPLKARGVVRSFDEEITGGSQRSLLILLGAVFLALLIACTNVAGLTLARAYGRAQEIGVRAALGASRMRLARQLLAESLSVAAVGGVLGTVAAFAIVRLLIRIHPGNIPRIEETSIDGRVLAFAVLATAATAVLAGVVPAWSASRANLNETLKRAGGRSVKSNAGRLHRGLMMGEIALTIVLLAGSGLLIRSFLKLQSVDKGFASMATVAMNVQLDGRYRQAQRQNAFFGALLEKAGAVPGVEAAAAVNHLPLGGGESIWMLEVEGRAFDAKISFEERSVTPRYFAAMGIPLAKGRAFTDGDAPGAPLVAMVSESFARRYFPGESAVGRRLHASGWRTIVGVVADVRQKNLDTPPPMQIYLPLWQDSADSADVVVRSSLPAERMAAALRGSVRSIDPALALADARTMDQLVSAASAERRFQMLLMTAFGGIALFLSLVGLYALMAWQVQQRTAEIGVRMALGAQRGGVMWMVLKQGASIWLAGMAAGFLAAWGLTRWLSSLLFEVEPTDPATFLAVAVLFCAVAVAACGVPARRATCVDPVISLRYE